MASDPSSIWAVRLWVNRARHGIYTDNMQRGQAALGISTTGAKLQSANQVLRTVHQVLTFEKVCREVASQIGVDDTPLRRLQDRKRAQLGSCLFGTNEVFAPLQALKAELLTLHGKM